MSSSEIRELLGSRADKHVIFCVGYRPHPQANPVIGATFQEYVGADRTSLCLWSEPAINATESACIREAMRDQLPMPPLIAPPLEAASETGEIPEVKLIERLKTEACVVKLQGSIGSDIALEPTTITVDVPFFIKSSLVNERRIERMIKACRSGVISRYLVQVECKRECITPASWNIIFRCRASASILTNSATLCAALGPSARIVTIWRKQKMRIRHIKFIMSCYA